MKLNLSNLLVWIWWDHFFLWRQQAFFSSEYCTHNSSSRLSSIHAYLACTYIYACTKCASIHAYIRYAYIHTYIRCICIYIYIHAYIKCTSLHACVVLCLAVCIIYSLLPLISYPTPICALGGCIGPSP